MGGISDFLFGKGALKKAAGETKSAPQKNEPANIDIRKMAQEEADKRQAAKKDTKKTTSGKKTTSKRMYK
jgi:hypothetical protein